MGTGLPSGLVGYGGDHPHWPRSDVAFDQAQTRPSASCVGVRLAGRMTEISLNSRSTTSRLSPQFTDMFDPKLNTITHAKPEAKVSIQCIHSVNFEKVAQ